MNNSKRYCRIGLLSVGLLAISGCCCCDSLSGTMSDTLVYSPGYNSTTIIHKNPNDTTVINYPTTTTYQTKAPPTPTPITANSTVSTITYHY